MSFSADEVDYLIAQHDEIAAVAPRLTWDKKNALRNATVMRSLFPEHSRAVMELLSARLAAKTKLPESWLMCTESAQQATPAEVALQRAHRLSLYGGVVHDITCSIGTEGLAVSHYGLTYWGSDLDRIRLKMARHNLGDRALIHQADALQPAVRRGDIIIADPARRQGGRRLLKPEDLLPPLPDLIKSYAGRELAIKCAPGLDYRFWPGLVSVSSVDGGVKEVCLYSEGLSGGSKREALVIVKGKVDRLNDDLPQDCQVKEPGRFIIDPDGAVVRAGLVRHYAVREKLWMLDERIAFLSGDAIPPGHSGFEFLEAVSLKKLRKAMDYYQAGSVEILIRGVEKDPDQLRRSLKLRGKNHLTLVLARIGDDHIGFICGPRQWGGSHPNYMAVTTA
ncbi:THUMP-like domain-containing protein [Corynebacterium sp. ES2775-CONJ]|uniref:THUMP-like domain-containing protein n=1 Tax=Corynebacterium sp. ES2775-CONJ TaxID=2974029 RepID=UPI002168F4A9|nr:SAM-dependent methyltransferase [Corynebacterium sp. ES2775-CONJ]MCS4489807.1 SAM-dependent methyltransferase [Corynebacterium sp. ES2775-CONJ]